MKKSLLLFAVLSFIIACGGSGSGDQTPATATSTKLAKKKVDGEKLYKNYCVTCHGVYGDMGASGAHDLSKSELSLEERVQVISKGRNTMTPFEGLLSAEKIKAVAEYTFKLAKKEEE